MARVAKALDAGAVVKLISPGEEKEGGLPSTLWKRVQDGQVEWMRREFVADDLTTLGREDVDRVVDRVFVTLPTECAQCKFGEIRVAKERKESSSSEYHRLLHLLPLPSLTDSCQRC